MSKKLGVLAGLSDVHSCDVMAENNYPMAPLSGWGLESVAWLL